MFNTPYLVKYTAPNMSSKTAPKGERYGVVDGFSDDAKKYSEKGFYIVSDCILPQSFLVKKEDVVEVEMSDWRKVDDWIEGDYKKALESCRRNDVLSAGDVFSVGVGDGYACYIVTKVNKKTCRVEWRGWGGLDRWTDSILGWGCTIGIDIVSMHVGRTKNPLFAVN